MEKVSSLTIKVEDPHSAAAGQLMRAMYFEVLPRYDIPLDEQIGDLTPEGVDGPGGTFMIAWAGDQAAGCGALRPMAPGVAEVKRVFVSEAFRGKRIAWRIMERLEKKAQEMGYHTLRLETGKLQLEAIALYQKMGYHLIPNYPPYEEEEISLCFEKHLGE